MYAESEDVVSKILLVEDEADLANEVADWLAREHYLVEIAATGSDALAMLRVYQYDVILLDWLLPGVSGIDVCKQFRSHGGSTPILMLTAKSGESDKESGLDCGADDYLTKPFGLRELSARIRALLRRAGPQLTTNVLTVNGLTLDPKARTVFRGDDAIHLEPREFSLLEFFMRHPNQVFDGTALIDRVWNSETLISEDTIRTYIKSLRKKIDADKEQPSMITTVRGAGYRFEAK